MNNRFFFTVLGIVGYLLICAHTVRAQSLKPPSKVWLTLGAPLSESKEVNWEWVHYACRNGEIVRRLKSVKNRMAGIIVPVFDGGHCLYATKLIPFSTRQPNELTCERDLQQLIHLANEQKIGVYLSINLLNWQHADSIGSKGIFKANPNWQEVRQQGVTPQAPDGLFASPFNPTVRQLLLNIVAELPTKFPDAAGIVLNLRLSNREILGFSAAARKAAMNDIGIDPIDLNLQNRYDDANNTRVRQWAEWRSQVFLSFLKEIRECTLKLNSSWRVIALGCADYYQRREFNELRTSQDWLSWIQAGAIDQVLVEGRWQPRYTDDRYYKDAVHNSKDNVIVQGGIVPLISGKYITSDSSYADDWLALQRSLGKIDEAAFTVQNIDDLKAIVEIVKGKVHHRKVAFSYTNEPAPLWILSDKQNTVFDSRIFLADKSMIWLVLRRHSKVSRASSKQVEEWAKKWQLVNVQPIIITSTAEYGEIQYVPCVIDGSGSIVSHFAGDATIVLVDKAGFIRKITSIETPQELSNILATPYDPTPIVKVGAPAPAFSVIDSKGNVLKLSSFKGKNLILSFFPKCFTGGCANHLTSFVSQRNGFKAADTQIVTISVDSANDQIAFARSLGSEFPMVPDSSRQMSLLFGAVKNTVDLANRLSILIDKNGIVRLIDNQVRPGTHGIDLLTKINEFHMGDDTIP